MHRRAAIGNGATNSNDYITHDGQEQTITASRQGDTSDHDYIGVATLDMRQDQDLGYITTGQYSSVKDSHSPDKDNAEKTTSHDGHVGENAGYEGIDSDDRDKERVKSSEVVMVENAGYEGIGLDHGGDKDNVNSTEVVMVENEDYEGIASE